MDPVICEFADRDALMAATTPDGLQIELIDASKEDVMPMIAEHNLTVTRKTQTFEGFDALLVTQDT